MIDHIHVNMLTHVANEAYPRSRYLAQVAGDSSNISKERWMNTIRKEERDKDSLLELNYSTHVWQEKEVKSVANVTWKDAQDFLPLAAEIPIIPEVQEFRLEEANEALILLKQGKIQGAAVLRMG